MYTLYETGLYRLSMGVECEFVAIATEQMALLDTGSELSVAGSEVYQAFLSDHLSLGIPLGNRILSTRLGRFEGSLHRVEILLKADWGEDLRIDGTFLFCEEWRGPTVLGFHGFLERIRLAIEPDYEKIGCVYFAATEL
ncbi:MAG: hypothetical protein BWK78_07640 [Thiotrichaceae bacterium IS1]|nr:MAG: hypothetical protein BWK78_07640 [Thiotrichaceae bacterium IS1]